MFVILERGKASASALAAPGYDWYLPKKDTRP